MKTDASPSSPNPVLAQLGYPPDARLVIFHADDVGMCHGSNRAFIDLQAVGIVQCGSLMAPCPWAPAILDYSAAHPTVDIGVHLTLTSEWTGYRWGPLRKIFCNVKGLCQSAIVRCACSCGAMRIR